MASNQERWASQLTCGDVDGRVAALRQIAGQESVTGLTAIVVELAGSSDDEVRMWAAEALETAIKPLPMDIEALIQALDPGDDVDICYWAATMLGRLGTEASVAAAALEKCLAESMYLPARERAAWALCQLGPSARSATETLRRTAQDAPPRLKRLATEALRILGEAA